MSDKNGGAAFPCSGYQEWQPQAGMTLREYFAAKAMQGFCVEGGKGSISDALDHLELVAALSFRMADAMIREGSK